MISLDRWRGLRIYLPKDYASSGSRYPVLYMLDGQNLYQDSTSYAGEWHIDESMDSLHLAGVVSAIVVGIDNGQELRMNEYNPFDSERFGPGEGKETMEFIVSQLKPTIDSTYRTLSDRKHTAIGGSSLGGLMAFYAVSEYPEVFSRAGVFSPSFWVDDSVTDWVPQLAGDVKVYMTIGSEEGDEMIDGMHKMAALMKERGFTDDHLMEKVVEGMEHGEKLWTLEFPQAYTWLFSD